IRSAEGGFSDPQGVLSVSPDMQWRLFGAAEGVPAPWPACAVLLSDPAARRGLVRGAVAPRRSAAAAFCSCPIVPIFQPQQNCRSECVRLSPKRFPLRGNSPYE